MNKDFTILDSKQELLDTVAERCLSLITSLLTADNDKINIGLTGGSVGVGIMKQLAACDADSTMADSRIHYWLSDERWLEQSDSERNDLQLTEAFFETAGISDANIHRYLYQNTGASLEEAADAYQQDWEDLGSPAMDLLMLGVGPDSHVASLFPGNKALEHEQSTILPVYDSPKAPSERLSFSMPLINQSQRVWISFAGEDKAEVFQALQSETANTYLPVTLVQGILETHIFVDRTATGS